MAEGEGPAFGFLDHPAHARRKAKTRTSVTFPLPAGLLKVMRTRWRKAMKDPIEVLRRKEAELERLQEEVEALRLVGKLLRGQPPTKQEPSSGRGKVLQMP